MTILLFRLLPVQVLLAAVGAVNGIVSSFFASNYVGIDAMSAVGLYAPLNMLITAISTILIGGSVILCGKYLGQNQQEKMQNVFSLDLMVTTLIGIAFIILFIVFAVFDLTGFITRDAAVLPLFNRYLLGQAIGVIPLMFGNSFASFLSLENMKRRTLVATVAYIIVNVLLNFLFVKMLHMEAFGLALSSSLGLRVFLGIQAAYFLSGRSHLRFSRRGLVWGESRDIVRIGLPGAASYIYQTARGLIVNWLLEIFVGSVGVSAFAAA
ncbi:MAG: polysaccharide biosynthesis C-terminal domain-containing protein, partial [Firmicutes bacterium]|nr:polysaccharide biosynthesis C-terminal domain-containing protein [Bacillota bacterium]